MKDSFPATKTTKIDAPNINIIPPASVNDSPRTTNVDDEN